MAEGLFEAPELAYVAGVVAELADPLELGETPEGRKRVIPIAGGRIDGPELAGRILPGGADWQRVLPDGTALIEARYTIELDGAEDSRLVSISTRGVRTGPPEVLAALLRGEEVERSRYYFRQAVWASTANERCGWLNTAILVASAERKPDSVRYDLYRLT